MDFEQIYRKKLIDNTNLVNSLIEKVKESKTPSNDIFNDYYQIFIKIFFGLLLVFIIVFLYYFKKDNTNIPLHINKEIQECKNGICFKTL